MSTEIYNHIEGCSHHVLTKEEQLRRELSMSYMIAVKQKTQLQFLSIAENALIIIIKIIIKKYSITKMLFGLRQGL